MNKEIICVYQDCTLCGDRGKKLKKLIFEKNLNVRKVSFASEEGKNLCRKAIFEHKIARMPFFVEGERFSQNLNDLLEEPKKVVRKIKKSRKSVKKEVENGLDS